MIRGTSPSANPSIVSLAISGLAQSQVPFVTNSSGLLAGDAGFTYNPSSDVLTVTGGLIAPNQYTANLTQALGMGLNSGLSWQVAASLAMLAPANDNLQDIGVPGQRARSLYGGGTIALGSRAVSGSYSMVTNDFTILCSTATGSLTIMLSSSPLIGQMINIKKVSADANTLTIDGNGRQVDSAATASSNAQTRPNFQVQFDQSLNMWNIL